MLLLPVMLGKWTALLCSFVRPPAKMGPSHRAANMPQHLHLKRQAESPVVSPCLAPVISCTAFASVKSRSRQKHHRLSQLGLPLPLPPPLSVHISATVSASELLKLQGGRDSVLQERSYLDDLSDPPKKVQLNHEEVSWEHYTGHCFAVPELVPGIGRHHGTRLKMNALGGEFMWTLNHEIVFSTALTGRPEKKLFFSQCCWKRCVVGTTEDYADATSKQEWEFCQIQDAWMSLMSHVAPLLFVVLMFPHAPHDGSRHNDAALSSMGAPLPA